MDLRKIRENLGRIKIYYLKGDSIRALGAGLIALKELVRAGIPLSTELRSMVREGMQLLSRDTKIAGCLQAPLAYQPGKERLLLLTLASAYKKLEADLVREEHDAAVERKRRLDQALNTGQKLLAQGKVSEADGYFQEALKYYRDEHRVFLLVGRWLQEAKQPRRAASYLKKALELEPENAEAQALYNAVLISRDEAAH